MRDFCARACINSLALFVFFLQLAHADPPAKTDSFEFYKKGGEVRTGNNADITADDPATRKGQCVGIACVNGIVKRNVNLTNGSTEGLSDTTVENRLNRATRGEQVTLPLASDQNMHQYSQPVRNVTTPMSNAINSGYAQADYQESKARGDVAGMKAAEQRYNERINYSGNGQYDYYRDAARREGKEMYATPGHGTSQAAIGRLEGYEQDIKAGKAEKGDRVPMLIMANEKGSHAVTVQSIDRAPDGSRRLNVFDPASTGTRHVTFNGDGSVKESTIIGYDKPNQIKSVDTSLIRLPPRVDATGKPVTTPSPAIGTPAPAKVASSGAHPPADTPPSREDAELARQRAQRERAQHATPIAQGF